MAARNWEAVKAAYLAGVEHSDLARQFRIPVATIKSRASRERWADDRNDVATIVQQDLPARVAEAIVAQAADDAIMSRAEVLQRLTHIARGGMQRVAEWGPGGVIAYESSDLSEADRALVAEVSETINQFGKAMRIKVLDPLAALRDLAKHHGILKDGDGKPGAGGVNGAPGTARPADEDLRSLGVDALRRILEGEIGGPDGR